MARLMSGSGNAGDLEIARASAPVAAPLVGIEATIASRLNLAFHQNAVPILRELVLVNNGDSVLESITLKLSSAPTFIAPKTWHIDGLGAGQRYHVTQLDIAVDGSMLGRLTEAERALASIVATAGGDTLARVDLPIELLARNQWGGIGHMPEMVAAFIQPNDPAVERLLKMAAEILRQHGKSGALDGYAGGSRRVWDLASSIWGAIGALGLDYALPPPSFECDGQKVRGPQQIAESRLATCLDLTLLFGAALEHCGLNPLVIFTHGHALAGVWLTKEEFTAPVVDDITALRKRAMLKELVLFETTLVTQRPCPSFAQAIERGGRQISEAEGHLFQLAVDVRRARMQRVRPLAGAEMPAPADVVAPVAPAPPVFDEPPIDLPDEMAGPAEEERPATAKDRLERWQRRLLDLSLRNTLLNFRARKRALTLDAPDPGRLEDLLAAGQSLRLLPRPALMEGSDPRSQSIHEARTNEDVHREFALDALRRNEVLVDLSGDELDGHLIELYRSARAALQEGGTNTLFLALGFLSWTRDARNQKRHRAPLVLVPVALQRKSVRSGFRLVLHDDQPRFNPTLLQLLRQDFHLTIPEAEGELPRDDSGLDIAGIWKAVGHAVKDVPGWEVVGDVVLATFSFAKHLMWKDLVERTDQLRRSPVVRHLIDAPHEPYPSTIAFPDPRRLDITHGPEQVFCPLPADSSQLSAIIGAAQGKDFVLVGPPGTGKSQTIANLIAQCLAAGKTVLFVSEKMAALNVVYRRLRDVGLGEFCLELHSNKARKLDVLDQLRRSWEAKGAVDMDIWRREALRLKSLRHRLNTFVETLHRRHRNGLTAYQAIGRVLVGSDKPAPELSWPSADVHDEAALDELRELVDRLDLNAGVVGAIADNPLALVSRGDWSARWQQTLLEAIRAMIAAAERLESAATALEQKIGMPPIALNRRTRVGLAALARILPQATSRHWGFVLRANANTLAERLRQGQERLTSRRELIAQLSPPLPDAVVQALRRGLGLLAQYREVWGQLSLPYGDTALDLDLDRLKADWTKAEQSFWPLRWMRAKAVEKVLMAAAASNQEPDGAADLDRLATLRGLRRELDDLGAIVAAAGVAWAGSATNLDRTAALLELQAAQLAVRSASPWQKADPPTESDGQWDGALVADYRRLAEIRAVETEIAAWDDLCATTDGLWAGLQTNPDDLDAALSFEQALSTAIGDLAATPEGLGAVKAFFQGLLENTNPLLTDPETSVKAGEAFLDAIATYDPCLESLAESAGTPVQEIEREVGDSPAAIGTACRSIRSLESKLHAWCAWRQARNDALGKGLAPLVAAMEQGELAHGESRNAFEIAYCRWWLNATIDGDAVLRTFLSAEHEKHIADFRSLEDRFTELTRAYIRARLCAKLPQQDDAAKSSEWGILRRETQKRRGHLALRDLIGRLPTALPRLAPCLLMSPLSIAQFLPADTSLFDIVVFDEASQIPVWDAIGAIARGRQVVMVGDPKQLPPTAFFERAEADAEEDGDIDSDLESILDECLGANLPSLNLSWHYRSRHESLIAFSNHYYYKGRLVTFPSPVTEDHAVSFHLVSDGVYEKGGARINKPEARAVVADLVGRIKNPAFRASKLTIGVVTFNAEQQGLIEDLLDEERRAAPEIEWYFAEDALEPVFVKNLENVQGDERDIMYFSITYGPDLTGAVSMNLGPMIRGGGERRLNVAITRARHELRVFSSLRPEQFDLSRTSALGVRDLKHFLEFAERGPRAIAEAIRGGPGSLQSPFEEAVAAALATRNWQVHPQVGVSSFRIDLGVVDPDASGRYLAGVECDGATYHRSATARDRDKLREQVLRGLGWEIIRIWSTDWWHDPTGALDKVSARLSALLEESRVRRAEEARREAQAAAASPVDSTPLPTDPDDNSDRGQSPTDGAAPSPSLDKDVFREADPASAGYAIDPDAFSNPSYDGCLLAIIGHVITVEGPVRDDVLARRIARIHGWGRTGSKIRDRVATLVRDRFPVTTQNGHVFLWKPGADTDTWTQFRRPYGDEPRPVDEIALPELIALAREMRAKGFTGDEAIAAMAQAAGLHKLRAASRALLEQAYVLAEGRLET